MRPSSSVLQFSLNKYFSLCINTANGAIDIVPVDFLSHPNNQTKSLFNQRGYFWKEADRMKHLTSLVQIMKRHLQSSPYWFYILTTLACNFQCPICYEKKTLNNDWLRAGNLEKIITTIKKFKKTKKISNRRIFLVIFGGEPLCLPDQQILEKIFQIARRSRWKCIIVTNGTLIKNYLDLFIKYRRTIADFRITIDGSKKIHDLRRPYKNQQGSFKDVVKAIDLLLTNRFAVKMQTILGKGNVGSLEELTRWLIKKGWPRKKQWQWRIEGSHDYANLDPIKDEISEGKMVLKLISLTEKYPLLKKKIKFESFKYLGHLVRSFGWLGDYKTYWGPKLNFCDPQRGLHYVFSTDGAIYHCPRTINNRFYKLGKAGRIIHSKKIRNNDILKIKKCRYCALNTLCGGGCLVQKRYQHGFNCQKYAKQTIQEFLNLTKDRILKSAQSNKIVSINSLWR